MPDSPKPSTRPPMPPGAQWILRVTGAVALLLFLTPTFYVIKYYAVDAPREQRLAEATTALDDSRMMRYAFRSDLNADDLLALTRILHDSQDWETQQFAAETIGKLLLQPGISWKRPLESLSAKAALAEVANDKHAEPNVRQAASDALGKVAQGGAVIRR